MLGSLFLFAPKIHAAKKYVNDIIVKWDFVDDQAESPGKADLPDLGYDQLDERSAYSVVQCLDPLSRFWYGSRQSHTRLNALAARSRLEDFG